MGTRMRIVVIVKDGLSSELLVQLFFEGTAGREPRVREGLLRGQALGRVESQ